MLPGKRQRDQGPLSRRHRLGQRQVLPLKIKGPHRTLETIRSLGLTWVAWALLGPACDDSGQRTEACQAKQPLVGGSPGADVLAMSNDQKRAIGRVIATGGPPGY